MEIVLYPDARLRRKTKPIHRNQIKAVKSVAKRMAAVMKAANGVGLAAPQVGLNASFFIVKPGVLPHDIIINPSWEPIREHGHEYIEEGCLSFPNLMVKPKRFNRIKVAYQCSRDRLWNMEYSSFAAQVFQHETDHLEGILLVDHIRNCVFSIEKD
jgi:peptide deformylase